ncbi:MAG: hypothetical protein AAGJ34_00770 [Pseudomonadota bacterium]
MQQNILILLASALMFTACGGHGTSPEDRAAREARETELQTSIENTVSVERTGRVFQVSAIPSFDVALVTRPQAGESIAIEDVESIAREATGCSVMIDAVYLPNKGQMQFMQLKFVEQSRWGTILAWSGPMSCP